MPASQNRPTIATNKTKPPVDRLAQPSGYRGLYAFHKYWGKKPSEAIAYLIDTLSKPGDLILDPFMGSGVTGIESVRLQRRFLGIDLNPVAVEIGRLLIDPPASHDLAAALHNIEHLARSDIESSYRIGTGTAVATHYLWDNAALRQIWIVQRGAGRTIINPTNADLERYEAYSTYRSSTFDTVRFFDNSRINTSADRTLADLFTGRARRNIDILLDAIRQQPADLRSALMTCLTAASGQMSKMVFAISRRGKTTNRHATNKVEVGSWVVGYWQPQTHFEVNVWNCFAQKTKRFLSALASLPPAAPHPPVTDVQSLLHMQDGYAVVCGDARKHLRSIPDQSVNLILADPPHGDRIPYLELSEMWNGLLGHQACYDDEIVITNARQRQAISAEYNTRLGEVWQECARILKPGGVLVILFNARQIRSWKHLQSIHDRIGEVGHFPLRYSTGSVVQDSRRGSLKHDIALVLQRPGTTRDLSALEKIDGWDTRSLMQD